jgi:DNA sulfur modification protein DndC
MSSCVTSQTSTAARCTQTLTPSCGTCRKALPARLTERIQYVRELYEESCDPWLVRFSGGKDSSAVLKIVYSAVSESHRRVRPIRVVYCDTGVEIPLLRNQVRQTFSRLRKEAAADALPITLTVVQPRLLDRYFVRVIGRGYPPPTNKFRWCTDRLRINPVRTLISGAKETTTVVVGTRHGESPERDRTLHRHSTESKFHFRQSGNSKVTLFAPIADFETFDVWATLLSCKRPVSVNGTRVLEIYKDAGAECPTVRESHGSPCGTGRFGCWTCTVVRKDRAVSQLVNRGYAELAPLLAFRDWLISMRDDPEMRCRRRRNGTKGPGPLTLGARREALRRLIQAQKASGMRLISKSEIAAIKALWRADIGSPKYCE